MNNRHKPEAIIAKLQQVDVLLGQRVTQVDGIGKNRIAEQAFYWWRMQYGCTETAQLKELRRLQKKTSRLRRAIGTPSQSHFSHPKC